MGRIRVGKPHVKIDAPAHVRGIREGNAKRSMSRQIGHHKDHTADARRSTGIRPKKHDAILKIMPNLPPG
ncbi:hypothetical protein [Actinoallomurus soli]|uniref:hypothetical protein n=1 Tax=Actinoallomurus soli TaxID=2952535 RepID=UPI002092A54D|nr:hypothetical protein [Actinoallomurus soli]MCO5973007.1 hypothetical protein [Actinoallomurus soli]